VDALALELLESEIDRRYVKVLPEAVDLVLKMKAVMIKVSIILVMVARARWVALVNYSNKLRSGAMDQIDFRHLKTVWMMAWFVEVWNATKELVVFVQMWLASKT
jgi:hypothetical protein